MTANTGSRPQTDVEAAPAMHSQLGRRQRAVVLLICSMSLLLVGLDVTIVNVALPDLQRSFGASLSGLQWTVDAYTLVLASLLLVAGSTADRLGRRRVFQAGLVFFSVGSLLCALAPSLPLLIGFRVLQAVGGSMLSPVAMSIVRNTFEDRSERARAIGIFASMFGISLAMGPVLGGLLVSAYSWRAVFIVSVPMGMAAFALAARFVPESRAPHPRRVDPVGQGLVMAALATLTYATIEAGRAGIATIELMVLLTASLAAVVLLIRHELHRDQPMIEVRFFLSAPFAGANAIALSLSVALGGFLFVNSLYLQFVRGLSPVRAGLFMVPVAVMVIVFAPISGRAVGRFGARPSLIVGGVGVAASGVVMTRLTPDASAPFLLIAYALFGLGFALTSPPIAHAAVSEMPPEQAGVAAAVATTSRQVGICLGVAICGAIAGAGMSAEIDTGLVAAALPVWWLLTALGLVVAALGYLSTTSWARGTVRRTNARLAQRERALGAAS